MVLHWKLYNPVSGDHRYTTTYSTETQLYTILMGAPFIHTGIDTPALWRSYLSLCISTTYPHSIGKKLRWRRAWYINADLKHMMCCCLYLLFTHVGIAQMQLDRKMTTECQDPRDFDKDSNALLQAIQMGLVAIPATTNSVAGWWYLYCCPLIIVHRIGIAFLLLHRSC